MMLSLKGLQALEATARTGGFASAAVELGVTAAAVGQLVRSLEAQVGRPLFHRVGRRLTPTEAALEEMPRLAAAFEGLDGVSRQLAGDGVRARLVVSAPPSVAAGWLAPRLAQFMAGRGLTDVSVRGETDPVEFDRDRIDIRLSYGRFHYRTLETEPVVTDAIFPVAAPKGRDADGIAADRLADATLIHTDWGAAAATFPGWRAWFETMDGAPPPRAGRGVLVDSSIAAIGSAAAGVGVALCQGLMAAGPIAEGRLRRIGDDALALAQPYCLTAPDRVAGRPTVAAFREWLKAALRADAVSGGRVPSS